MNDATRELGAALGIAVLGSIAASQYSSGVQELTAGLPAAAADQASASSGRRPRGGLVARR